MICVYCELETGDEHDEHEACTAIAAAEAIGEELDLEAEHYAELERQAVQ